MASMAISLLQVSGSVSRFLSSRTSRSLPLATCRLMTSNLAVSFSPSRTTVSIVRRKSPSCPLLVPSRVGSFCHVSRHVATCASLSSAEQSVTSASADVSTQTLGLTTEKNISPSEVSISFSDADPLTAPCSIIFLAVPQSALTLPPTKSSPTGTDSPTTSSATVQGFSASWLSDMDRQLDGFLLELANEEEFSGRQGQCTMPVRLPAPAPGGAKKIALLGLGKGGTVGGSVWKSVGVSVSAAAKKARAQSVGLVWGEGVGAEVESATESTSASGAEERVTGTVVGILAGGFEDVRFKSSSPSPASLSSIHFFGLGSADSASSQPMGERLAAAAELGKKLAAGVIEAKKLVNAPPNLLTPVALAAKAESLAAAHPDVLSATILSPQQCSDLGMGAYLAVGAASENEPRFIHLTYKPPGGQEASRKVALVGKGVTFDSGGYNLKAGAGSMIELMKFDMGGAAALLGAARSLALLRPPGVEVHFIVAACENMISGSGMRPGDIITASNGKTIEVNNTDAEGRLTLADALVYAGKQGVQEVVDVATLTGACAVALGSDVAGLFTQSDRLAQELQAASTASGDKVWRMPMEEAYWESMKSLHADMQNTGPRFGGSITAALFLKEYVDANLDWAHIDMAGPVWSEKKGGGTGFAVSLLVHWVLTKSHQ